MSDHLMFAKETGGWGTWLTPDKALPVVGAKLTGAQPLMDNPSTGLLGRGAMPSAVGEVGVTAEISGMVYPTVLPWLMRGFNLNRAASVAAGTGFKNKMLPDDAASFDSFSMQAKFSSAIAMNIKGAKVNQFSISANAKELAKYTMGFVAKDIATDSGFWSDGITAAPAIVASPPYTTMPAPFKFYEAVMKIGGTTALTLGELVVTGGTARNDFDNIEIGWDFGLGADAYGVNLGDRTVQSIDEGPRNVTVKFSPNWAIVGTEFWEAWKAGTAATIELFFQSAAFYNTTFHYEMKITLPYVQYTAAPTPDVARSYGLRRVSVEGQAKVDPTTGYDYGIMIQSTEDLH